MHVDLDLYTSRWFRPLWITLICGSLGTNMVGWEPLTRSNFLRSQLQVQDVHYEATTISVVPEDSQSTWNGPRNDPLCLVSGIPSKVLKEQGQFCNVAYRVGPLDLEALIDSNSKRGGLKLWKIQLKHQLISTLNIFLILPVNYSSSSFRISNCFLMLGPPYRSTSPRRPTNRKGRQCGHCLVTGLQHAAWWDMLRVTRVLRTLWGELRLKTLSNNNSQLLIAVKSWFFYMFSNIF